MAAVCVPPWLSLPLDVFKLFTSDQIVPFQDSTAGEVAAGG